MAMNLTVSSCFRMGIFRPISQREENQGAKRAWIPTRTTHAPRISLRLHPGPSNVFHCPNLEKSKWRKEKGGKPTFLEKRIWVESPASSTGTQCRTTSLS